MSDAAIIKDIPNWDGQKYQWFKPIEWRKFVKRIDNDFDCEKISEKPEGNWKQFWKFYFTWKKHVLDEELPENLPEFCTPEEGIDIRVVRKKMVEWRDVVVETYKEYNNAKLHNLPTNKYVNTMLYWGWRTPQEPLEMSDISKNISEYYFTKNMDSYAKVERAPFCTEPLALEEEAGVLKQFYFVAPAQISSAFIEAEVDGVTKKFESEEDLLKVVKGSVSKKYFVAGGVSDTSRDLDQEKMSEDCIHAMEEYGRGGDIPLRNAHNKEWDSDLGHLTDIHIEDNEGSPMLMCKFELNNFEEDPIAKKLWYAVNNGKKIGYSIGGVVKTYHREYDQELRKEIVVYDNIELKEVSVTGHPANTHTFIYSISKALKSLEKKPLGGHARPDAIVPKFAYVSKDGKTKKISIRNENDVRNAMKQFDETDIPESEKSSAWKKILVAARMFGVKPEAKKSEDVVLESLNKYAGVNIFLTAMNEAVKSIDVKNNSKELEEEKDTPMSTVYADSDDDGSGLDGMPEDDDLGDQDEIEELRCYVKVMRILGDLDYPEGAEIPKDYYEVYDSMLPESFIYVGGQKILPHHNLDYTVNKDWLNYQLKKVMDGEVYLNLSDYLTVLQHLHYHAMEMKKVNKSTEPDGEQVDPKLAETPAEQSAEVPAEAPVETPVETPVEAEEAAPVEEALVEEAPVEAPAEQPAESDPVEEEEESEDAEPSESEKALKAVVYEMALLKKQNAELKAEMEVIQKSPIYKTATEEVVVANTSVRTGEELSKATGRQFSKSAYTLDEALDEAVKVAPYEAYTVKQQLRQLFPAE